jgi:serine/threonine protein kinase
MEPRLVAGRYELGEQIGESSWRATDTELGREVLLTLPAHDAAAAALSHPSIVRVFDQGEADGTPYAVFEYVPGGSLEQWLAQGPLTERAAHRIATDLAAALAYAHAQRVTHGSIRAANVLLDGEGRAKLTGFAGTATPEEDRAALAGLVQVMEAGAISDAQTEATAVLPAAAPARRRPLALIAVAALLLLAAGIAAAFIATSGGTTAEQPTGSIPISTGTTTPTTRATPPVATTAETTTEETTTTAPATTATPTATTPPATAPPPPTTAPLPTTAPPPPTTEPLPTTEPPPPTTEPPPVTTAAVTTG